MYFPTTSAKLLRPSSASTPHDLPPLPSSLAEVAKLGGAHDEVLLGMSCQTTASWRSYTKTGQLRSRKLAALIGGSEIAIWSVRPAVLLCKLRRTNTSLRRYGHNKEVHWVEDPDEQPGQCAVIVLTTKGFILCYSILNHGGSTTTPVYSAPGTSTGASKGQFVNGSGESMALPPLVMQEIGSLDFSEQDITSLCTTPNTLLVATANPPALHTLSYAIFTRGEGLDDMENGSDQDLQYIDYVSDLPWIIDTSCHFMQLHYNPAFGLYSFLASDGRAYAVKDFASINNERRRSSVASEPVFNFLAPQWDGQCFYGAPTLQEGEQTDETTSTPPKYKALSVAFNEQFSLVALGLSNGQCVIYSIVMPSQAFMHSHHFSLRDTLKSTAPHLETGPVQSLAWTSDGYALAVGWKSGWSVWTVYGRLTTWAVGGDTMGAEGSEPSATFEDRFMNGIGKLFWAPGNLELFALTEAPANLKGRAVDEQFFAIPFAKSAVTSLHTPDNTNQAFLQLDDGLLVYRGADQPDMSVINPESDVWQHIKIPSSYISNNWPVSCACISADARLIAVAGRRGFTHYNALSGRWKLFENETQEQSFKVRGGMQWYGSTLVVATEEDGGDDGTTYKLRLFGRDRPLNMAYVSDEETFPSPIILTSLFDSSLLVYTEDNTFYHYILTSGKDGPKMQLCGSIGFEGVVSDPRRVRGLSWMVPKSQQRFGAPEEDLNFATVIFLIEGRLVLLRPRRAFREEVKYDMQILADRIEFYWTHLTGIGTLENSLWGWDGQQIRVWLNALTIDSPTPAAEGRPQPALARVDESLAIEIDFYPLSVLMDKGIVVGVEHETSYRKSLDFAIFRLITNTHLFIHHVLRFHLTNSQTREAVIFASHYQHLVYFAHALEILLHSVLEDEADALPQSSTALSFNPDFPHLSRSVSPAVPDNAVLPRVVDFLDHFVEALQVVVNCARKTEITRWAYLFQFVGKPRDLFEKCMDGGQLKIAASYLLVLHNLEPIEQSSRDTVRLLKAAMAKDDWQLCKELSRFLFSLDHTGEILRSCLGEAGALPPGYSGEKKASPTMPSIRRSMSAPVHTDLPSLAIGTSPKRPPLATSSALGLAGSPASSTVAGPTPFMRTGSTARAMHYRMASGSGLGLGTLLQRVGSPNPNERFMRSRTPSRAASSSSLVEQANEGGQLDAQAPEPSEIGDDTLD